MNPEQIVPEAFTAGRRAALNGVAPSLNPFDEGSAQHAQWQQGHQSGTDAINAYAGHKSAKEDWMDRSDYDLTTSGSKLRAGQ